MVRFVRPAAAADFARRGPAFFFLVGFVAAALPLIIVEQQVLSIAACFLALPAGVGAAVRAAIKGKVDFRTFFALGAALGLLFGGARSRALALERARSYSVIPLTKAARFRITLTDDGVVGAGGVRFYPGELSGAADRDGCLKGGAAGSVLAFVPEGPALFWGESVEIEGKIRESDGRGGTRYVINARRGSVSRIGFTHPLFAARAAVVRAIRERTAAFGAPASSLFDAFFLGIKDNLDFELRDAFARTGSLHLLALSGLHVGLIAALLLFLFSPLRSLRMKAVIACFGIGVYFFIAGPSPSLLRAVLMLGLGTIGLLLDREIDPLHLLFMSAAVVIVFDPESVRSLSFQLSYLSLFGILTFGRRMNRALAGVLPTFVRGLFSAALAAQAFTAPLLLKTFGVIYPVGLLVSLFLVPLSTAYLWSGTGLLVVSLAPITLLRETARWLMEVQYRLIFGISNFFKSAPGIALPWSDWLWIPAFVWWLALTMGIPLQRRNELRIAG